MGLFRRGNQVLRSRRDGRFDVILAQPIRAAIERAVDEIDEILDDPDQSLLVRLHPNPYLDDPEQEAAWQLIAGEQLRTARREAFETMRRLHDSSVATDEELWSWIRALNTLRLVLATVLGIEDDRVEHPEPALDHPSRPAWELYQLSTFVQHEIVSALAGTVG